MTALVGASLNPNNKQSVRILFVFCKIKIDSHEYNVFLMLPGFECYILLGSSELITSQVGANTKILVLSNKSGSFV